MEISCHFIHMKASQRLEELMNHKLDKLSQRAFKAHRVECTFYQQGHSQVVEMVVHGYKKTFKAIAKSDDFVDSMDKCVAKMMRQIGRKREKIKRKPKFEHSNYGKILQMNDQMEWEPPALKRAS